jgi:16S rRNA (cytosine967-C5)-methyltransferase
MRRGVAARATAATLLARVTDEGAYANVVVRTGTRDLERRDALFVQRLVYTALRMLNRIDRVVDERVSRPVDPIVRAVLRIGVGELLFTGGDAYASVDSAVEAVRALGAPRAAGFVNGVLRAVSREGEPPLPRDEEGRALELGVPVWLMSDLVAAFGEEDAVAFLEASNAPSQVCVRRRAGPAPGEPVESIDGAYVVPDTSALRAAIERGDLVVADPSSTAVAAALDPKPGHRVLDLAAAPGGKTLHLWDLMSGEGLLVGMDRNPRRVGSARRRLSGLGADPHWVVGDARHPPFAAETFDRILLDAPCTGLGTLRRRPEIRHRLRPESAYEAGRTQRLMLEAAVSLLRPGGRLVYSVCTVTPHETSSVVEGMGTRGPEGTPGRDLGAGVLLAPHITGSDGMFIAVLER